MTSWREVTFDLRKGEHVSIPYRGLWQADYAFSERVVTESVFQSPIEVYDKLTGRRWVRKEVRTCFNPLSRFMTSWRNKNKKERRDVRFQSPIEVYDKLTRSKNSLERGSSVSIPYRGLWQADFRWNFLYCVGQGFNPLSRFMTSWHGSWSIYER